MYRGQHGMTSKTMDRILLGAGTIHVGLELKSSSSGSDTSAFNFAESLLCATSGGNSLEIKSTLYDVPIDGVGVKVKGGVVKTGESGTLTVNALDLTPEILSKALFMSMSNTQALSGYSIGHTGGEIKDEHWAKNLAYVGETVENRKPIIVIFNYAICTSGAKIDGKSFEASVLPLTFEAYRGYAENDRMTSLGISIYYPEMIDTVSAASLSEV